MDDRKTDVHRMAGHWAGRFYDPCWDVYFHVIWPQSRRRLSEHAIKRYIKAAFGETVDDVADSRGICWYYPDHNTACIVLAQVDGSTESFDTIAHECFHAAHFTLDARGVKLTNSTREAYAYLTGSLVGRVLELVGRSRRRKQ